MVHMPSHIYYRVGLYKDALQSKVDAMAVDEQYFARQASDAIYKGGYHPHNIHFAMVSALMGGDGKQAIWRCARATGYTRKGMLAEAQTEIDALAVMENDPALPPWPVAGRGAAQGQTAGPGREHVPRFVRQAPEQWLGNKGGPDLSSL